MLYQQRVIQEVARHLVIHYPRRLLPLLTRMPVALQIRLLTLALNYFLREPIVNGELEFFEDKVLELYVSDINWQLSIKFNNKRLNLNKSHGTNDVFFCATSVDFLRMATQSSDPDTLFFQRRLQMQGDTELGLAIKNLLAAMDLRDQLPDALLKGLKTLLNTHPV